MEEIRDTHRLSQVLNSQGFNLMALDKPTEPQNAFHSALQMPRNGGLLPSALHAIMGVAALNIQQEPSPEMLEPVMNFHKQ